MNISKISVIAVALVCTAIAVIGSRILLDMPKEQAISHAQAIPVSKMQQKLYEAQGLLRAITYKDFGNIKSGAQKLSEISFESQWSESTSPRYDIFSEEFRYNLSNMVQAAEEENLDAATLSYLQVIMNCVACHEEVREGEEIAFLKVPELPAMFQVAQESN